MARKRAGKHQLPEPIAEGQVLVDLAKKQWLLGKAIGKGGFGEIYCAKESSSKAAEYPYVIKIEPHANGPLFVERKFYMANAKQGDIDAFKRQKSLKSLGLPRYIASGSHDYNGSKYRFMVMDRFGDDLWKVIEKQKDKTIPWGTVFKLAAQILDVLEYIHSRGYIHADIKPSNVLFSTGNNNQVYLVDYGLATKFTQDKDFKPDKKRAHDGTLEFLSRDAHKGVQTRRGDLEILAYNIIRWAGCTLPWEKFKKSDQVQEDKEANMSDIKAFLERCFGKGKKYPDAIIKYLDYITSLSHDEEPDYAFVRKLFVKAMEEHGEKINGPFNFDASMQNVTKRNRKVDEDDKSPVKKASKGSNNAKKLKDEVSGDSNDEIIDSTGDEEDLPILNKKVAIKGKTAGKSLRAKNLEGEVNGDSASDIDELADEEDLPIPNKKVARKGRTAGTLKTKAPPGKSAKKLEDEVNGDSASEIDEPADEEYLPIPNKKVAKKGRTAKTLKTKAPPGKRAKKMEDEVNGDSASEIDEPADEEDLPIPNKKVARKGRTAGTLKAKASPGKRAKKLEDEVNGDSTSEIDEPAKDEEDLPITKAVKVTEAAKTKASPLKRKTKKITESESSPGKRTRVTRTASKK